MDKKTIISAAFRVWAADMYMKTSLADLARELGMTKPALYRYFHNKDELLSTMLESAVEEYKSGFAGVREQFAALDFRGSVELFARSTFRFYKKNSGYFYFFARFLLHHEHPYHSTVLGLLEEDAKNLGAILIQETNCSQSEAETVLGVLFTHMLFWCELTVGASGPGTFKGIDEAARLFTESLFDGFFPEESPVEFDPVKIEANISFCAGDFPVHNKRLSAVMNVIAREGIANASVRKIAAELNISKSSLYSFFKNKNDMLTSVLEKHRVWLERISGEKLTGNLKNNERLYGFMYIILLSFLQDRRKAVFLNWLRFQNFKPEESASGFNFRAASMTTEIWEDSRTRTYSLQASQFEGCFRVQLVRAIMENLNRNGDLEEVPDSFRKIFMYLAFGLEKTIMKTGD